MSILSEMLEGAVTSAVGEVISQGKKTVPVVQKSYIRYQCFQCKEYSIHVHRIKMEGKADKRLWNSIQETEKKAAEKARKDIRRIDEITFHEINCMHNYGHINEEIFCPFCHARQPWSRGRGKKELELMASPDYIHPTYYNESNIEELRQIMQEEERTRSLSESEVRVNIGQPTPYMASSLGKARYDIEHRMLWQHFFAQREKTIAILCAKDGLFTLYRKVLEENCVHNPYGREDFHVRYSEIGNNLRIYTLELPSPEHVPLCYRIYMLFDSNRPFSEYYTVERGIEGGFLCGWAANGCHGIYCSISSPEWTLGDHDFKAAQETDLVIDLYKKAYEREYESHVKTNNL